jgi:small subunit ribosomal protein S30e
MGKVHGSLARAGKVKKQTPKVAKAEKPKAPRGRAMKRAKYNKRFLTASVAPGMKRKANPQQPGKMG